MAKDKNTSKKDQNAKTSRTMILNPDGGREVLAF